MKGQPRKPPDPIQLLQDDFRRHLEVFYGRLKLAPPYHSVEKAIAALTAALKALSTNECERVAADSALQWQHYQKAFVDSGLHRKHRGIIIGLMQSQQLQDLPSEYAAFLQAFTK